MQDTATSVPHGERAILETSPLKESNVEEREIIGDLDRPPSSGKQHGPLRIDTVAKEEKENKTVSRIDRNVISTDALSFYNIKYSLDKDPKFLVIPRHVPDFELDFLAKLTQELRKTNDALNGPPSSGLPSNGNLDRPPRRSDTFKSTRSDKPDKQAFPPIGLDVGGYSPVRRRAASAHSYNSDELSVRSYSPERPRYDGANPQNYNPPLPAPDRAAREDRTLRLSKHYVPFERWNLPWTENDRGKCVIDIAVQKEPNYSQRPPFEESEMRASQASSEPQDLEGVPMRLGINSKHIKFQLFKLTKHDFSHFVMQAPWKFLIEYGDKIRERVQQLQSQLDEIDTGDDGHEDDDMEVAESTKDETKVNETEPPKPSTEKKASNADPPRPSTLCDFCGSKPLSEHEGVHKRECLTDLKDAIKHLGFLVDFMDNDIKEVFELRKSLRDGTATEIAHENLWHLFDPGDLIVTAGLKRARRAFRVFYITGGRIEPKNIDGNFEKYPPMAPFKLHCYYMDYDKKWLGPVYRALLIPKFEGKKPITALPMLYVNSTENVSAFPIRFLEDPENARADLIERGKRFQQLTPFAHKRYCGPSTVEEPEYLNSEIIFDLNTFTVAKEAYAMYTFGTIELNRNEAEICPASCGNNNIPPFPGCTDLFNDNVIDRDRATNYTKDLHALSLRDVNDKTLTDEHLVLLPASIDVFVLRERDTFGVFVDLVQDLDSDAGGNLGLLKKKSGFEDLVLPDGHGDLVEALVRTHRSTARSVWGEEEQQKVQVDLTDGKGEGLIILLHGVPGVGKTSTAECVAAYTGRPLYPITCANIGLDPADVEKNLTGPDGHFRKAQQWNCVVLLDEADVFLAKREARDNDAKRNALVSVFLRTLEYYPGILILTTNRVGSFDEAVVSRIQLFLYYPPLNEDQTRKVWRVHINRVRTSGLIKIDREDEAMIMDFAKEEWLAGRRWNGRQIRNFFQTAISLASYDATKWHQQSIADGEADKDSKAEKPRLTTRTLKIVAATTGKFIDYVNSTIVDGSHQMQQTVEGNRNDSWEDTPKKSR